MGEKSTLVDFFSIECRKDSYYKPGWHNENGCGRRMLAKLGIGVGLAKWGMN